jgi:hypothetical protein
MAEHSIRLSYENIWFWKGPAEVLASPLRRVAPLDAEDLVVIPLEGLGHLEVEKSSFNLRHGCGR